MRFHKIISTIFHPIVVPTIGVLLYFIFVSQSTNEDQRLILLGLIFIITYIIPLLLLILLKALGLIQSFQVKTIKERRFPVLFMIVLFYLLGNFIAQVPAIRNLGFLFYGTSFSLFGIYVLFAFKVKSSLHLVSFGNAIGFFLAISNLYYLPLLPVIMILFLISGLVASSRLHLKAHTPKELFAGFSMGLLSQVLLFLFLQ